MEEILHHLLHMKPYVLEILHLNWLAGFLDHQQYQLLQDVQMNIPSISTQAAFLSWEMMDDLSNNLTPWEFLKSLSVRHAIWLKTQKIRRKHRVFPKKTLDEMLDGQQTVRMSNS